MTKNEKTILDKNLEKNSYHSIDLRNSSNV